MKGDETFALPATSTPFVMTSGRAGSSSAVIRAGSNVPPAPALPCVLQWFRRSFLLFFFFPGSPTVWLGVLVLIPHRLVRPAFLASSPLVLLLPAAPSPSGRSRAPLFAAQASRLGRSACPRVPVAHCADSPRRSICPPPCPSSGRRSALLGSSRLPLVPR